MNSIEKTLATVLLVTSVALWLAFRATTTTVLQAATWNNHEAQYRKLVENIRSK